MNQAPWKALPGAVYVAASRCCDTLLVMDLAANFQATAHAVNGASATLVLRDGAIDTGETVFTFAASIMAVPLAAAFLLAGLQGAVMTSTSRVTSTLTVHAGSIAGAVSCANLLAAVITAVTRTAEAGAVETVTIWRPASGSTVLVGAVKSTPTLNALANSIVALALVAAPVGAHLHGSTTIKTGEALSAVARSVHEFAIFALGQRGFALQANESVLAKTVVTLALTVHTVGAVLHHLVTGFTGVARLALALTSETIAGTVHGATVRAKTQLTSSSLVPSSAVASSVDTLTMSGAVLGTGLHRAVKACPALVADTLSVAALTMTTAQVRAWSLGTVHTSVTGLAEAGTVLADAMVRATVQACTEGAILAHPSVITFASEVSATSVSGAFIRANHPLSTICSFPPVQTLASSVDTDSMSIAVTTAGSFVTSFTFPSRGAVASSIAAVSIAGTILRA